MRPLHQKERSCLDKARQPDEATARAVAMHMLATGIIKSRKAWVYACIHCRGWHVTTVAGGNYGGAAVSATNPWVPSAYAAAREARRAGGSA